MRVARQSYPGIRALNVVGFDTATDDTVIAARSLEGTSFDLRVGPGDDGRPAHSAALLDGVEPGRRGTRRLGRRSTGSQSEPGRARSPAFGSAWPPRPGWPCRPESKLAGVPTLAGTWPESCGGGGSGRPAACRCSTRGEARFSSRSTTPEAERCGRRSRPLPKRQSDDLSALNRRSAVGGPGAVRFGELFGRAGIGLVDPESGRVASPAGAICELGAGVSRRPPAQSPETELYPSTRCPTLA